MSLLSRDSSGANVITIQEHPSGAWGVYTSYDLAAGATVGVETDPSTESALDPATVLAAHPKSWAVIGSGAKAQMEQHSGPDGLLPANAKTRTTEGPHAGGGTRDVRHDT